VERPTPAASGDRDLDTASGPARDPSRGSTPGSTPGSTRDSDGDAGRRLGDRLRRIRQQQGMSLLDVEDASSGRFKASVLGAYERGERSVSMARLRQLADFYRIPVVELLPTPARRDAAPRPTDDMNMVIDLVALEREREQAPALARYAATIQARRGDYNGRVLTVRRSDFDTLAAVLDDASGVLRERLVTLGVLR
jgi:transcriptional regulator with XRE-family HTH domain